MWILQEYRFFLIIAVIALAGIIALFFTTQNSQALVDFNTEVKSNYAQIKGQAGETKSLYDVVTVDGTTYRGMDNDQLFGLSHDYLGTDLATPATNAGSGALLVESTTDLDDTTVKAPAGSFAIVYVANDVVTADTTGADDSVSVYTGDVVNAAAKDNSALKGWNLTAGGQIAYIFEDAATAEEVIADYIPEGSLVGNSVVVPFINQ